MASVSVLLYNSRTKRLGLPVREREEVIDSLITNSTSLTIKDVSFYLSLQESLSWTESGEEVTDVGSAEVPFRQSNDRLLPKSSAEPFFPPFFACFILKLDRESSL